MQFFGLVMLASCVVLLATFLVGVVKVLREGRAGVAQMDRAGFGARAYWKAELPRQSASSSVVPQEGVVAHGSGGRVHLRQTRTLSREFS